MQTHEPAPAILESPLTMGDSTAPRAIRLVIIDDDLLSREVLALLAIEAGVEVVSFECGEDALAHLAETDSADVVMTDIQMPGVSGAELARLLRLGCGPATRLLAMSGSELNPALTSCYDGFLLKPFGMEELLGILAGDRPEAAVSAPEATLFAQDEQELWTELHEPTFQNMARSMPATQLQALYAMCLDDAERRVKTLEAAFLTRDPGSFVQAAHAIKGGCSMVGARALAAMAARMEKQGLPEVDDSAPVTDLLDAICRLRVMLVTHRAFERLTPG